MAMGDPGTLFMYEAMVAAPTNCVSSGRQTRAQHRRTDTPRNLAEKLKFDLVIS
jgi:hypothetical protein